MKVPTQMNKLSAIAAEIANIQTIRARFSFFVVLEKSFINRYAVLRSSNHGMIRKNLV